MALQYEVHPRNGFNPIDLYNNSENGDGKHELVAGAVVYPKTRKLADEICAALNNALLRGHVEVTERLGL